MTKLLLHLFGENKKDPTPLGRRDKLGRLAGFVGIGSNLVLFLLKLVAGFLSGSIAIMADAVNNLTDCASSVITLVGFRLAKIPADDEHPYGHARFEYISGLAVSALVLIIGFEFLQSSVKKIITPQDVSFTLPVALVLAVSVCMKLWQGSFNKKVGRMIDSSALSATATDSRNDAVTTATVLLASILAHFTGWRLDGWMGALVALFVLWSGVQLIGETASPLLGAAPDKELVEKICHRIMGYESVIGLHDLMVHNYGPGRCFASVHVEVPASQDILLSHDIIDNIERDFSRDLDISLVIHMDPVVTDDARTNRLHTFTEEKVRELDPSLSIHDFRMVEGKTHTNLIFDVVIPPRYRYSHSQLRKELSRRITLPGETLYCVITVDQNYTSTTE